MVLSLSVFSQYSWADSIYGVTNNAAVNGLNWSMTGVLPDSSAPNVSLQVNGLTYYYVMSKNPEDAAKVYVRNADPVNGGYIFEEVDDWTGVPGNSIQKYFTDLLMAEDQIFVAENIRNWKIAFVPDLIYRYYKGDPMQLTKNKSAMDDLLIASRISMTLLKKSEVRLNKFYIILIFIFSYIIPSISLRLFNSIYFIFII